MSSWLGTVSFLLCADASVAFTCVITLFPPPPPPISWRLICTDASPLSLPDSLVHANVASFSWHLHSSHEAWYFHQECGSCCQLPFGNQSNNVFWKCTFYHTMVYPLLQVIVYFLSWQIVYKFSRMIILWEGSREGFTDEETSKFDFERLGVFRDNKAGHRIAKPIEHCKQPRHSCLSDFNDSPWITGHLWTGHSVLHAWVWFM